MKKTLKIDLPERAALEAALQLRVPPKFQADKADAERTLAQLRGKFADASRRAEQLSQSVSRGAATLTDVENVIRQRDAAALAIVSAEARVTAAVAALEQAETAAKNSVVDEAERVQREELQRTADQVAVVLDELLALERELDRAVVRNSKKHGVSCVTWPEANGIPWGSQG